MTLHRRALLAGTATVLAGAGARAQQPDLPPALRLPVRPQTGEVVQPLPKAAPGSDLDVIDLWPDLPPGGGGPFRSEYRFDETLTGVITAVARPCLLVIRPQRPNGAGVLIAAGGGYLRIDIGNEGLPVGQWLARAGITAFVLVYRLPSEEWRDGPDAPRQDAQRAMRLIRWKAEEYGLDPDRIGVLGFSAGGHLMGVTATDAEQDLYDDMDDADGLSARPSFAGLIYPIITMRAPFDRTMSSRRVLVGDDPPDARRRAYSVEVQVNERTPPVFMVQASDDRIAVTDHPLLMYAALRAAKVPAEMHLFERGGHGFGLGVPGSPAAAWPALFMAWMRGHGLLKS
ncbi:MAG TPA: alpha/beta hydrolase [Methylobacterium sp.]|jgi:acetyl esterase/lipase|uniref:alpha/beta hydrolase n=1 Tax=Methylorubrum sp. B1-46 TaxID=2897334 RepID=UPI001E406B4E|nr:alpha/beta hydrolase [Methylorubrum sp. B1-46]UGB24192.1 alpha/beta hydrolase [Methylorubrum sp. B1-46]HEV2545673.1 alpha/beta hydrolase [Methylobacterium sp.]